MSNTFLQLLALSTHHPGTASSSTPDPRNVVIWELELARLAIQSGALHKDHIAIQALGVLAGTLLGLWASNRIPWGLFAGWYSFCESMFYWGGGAAYNLLHGRPLVDGSTSRTVNFVSPSIATLERSRMAIDFTEGPRPALEEAFIRLVHARAGSDLELLKFRSPDKVSAVVAAYLGFDSAMLARGAFIDQTPNGAVLRGVSPPLSDSDCRKIWELDTAARNAALKTTKLVTGVEEHVVSCCAFSLSSSIGRFFNSAGVPSALHADRISK